ncbi:MAG: hypothetical protein KDK99_17445 [Verrucomicrobiales bacterium]|nr:hypothetical protein [Verrucomicrobiales bacterium]
MSDLTLFRHYQIVQDADGHNVELARTAEQVTVLAFDTIRLEYAHLHVLLQPLTARGIFEDTCRRLRSHGHPLLARLVDFGEDEGNPFYITGSVDGETLRTYLDRQRELPCWLAVMVANRALEAAAAVCERGDYLTAVPLESLRVVQVSPRAVVVAASDYRLTPGEARSAAKSRALRSNFDKHGRFLRAFLVEQCGEGPTLPDQTVTAADFTELLAACLAAADPAAVSQMMELRNSLMKLAPQELVGEIPAAQKPRALLAPLLASYQEVARAVVNQVRIQSQRLDMTQPYSMRGTLTKAGRTILVEQVPPRRAGGERVLEADRQIFRLGKKREYAGLVTLALVQEAEEITCVGEEVVEGISLAELLRERGSLEVQEAYLVLAGLDAALAQVDEARLPTHKLRLEDVFLLIGGSREDPRSAKLLQSKLNDWPAFSVVVRAHPCLAGMVGRGTDPGLLLPPGPTTSAEVTTLWHGGWLAAMGRFVLGLERSVGAENSLAGAAAPQGREQETVERLLEDELEKCLDGKPSPRSAFLSRFARIVHHYDLVKPIPGVTEIPPAPASEGKKRRREVPAAPPPRPAPREEEPSPPPAAFQLGSLSLPSAKDSEKDRPSVGFAEILFQSGGESDAPEAPDWAGTAGLGERGGPRGIEDEGDRVPLALKLAVFLLGSLVVGGMLAHFSGQALWQKGRAVPKVPPGQEAPASLEMSGSAPTQETAGTQDSAADAVRMLEPKAGSRPAPTPSPTVGGDLLRPAPPPSLRSKLEQ